MKQWLTSSLFLHIFAINQAKDSSEENIAGLSHIIAYIPFIFF